MKSLKSLKSLKSFIFKKLKSFHVISESWNLLKSLNSLKSWGTFHDFKKITEIIQNSMKSLKSKSGVGDFSECLPLDFNVKKCQKARNQLKIFHTIKWLKSFKSTTRSFAVIRQEPYYCSLLLFKNLWGPVDAFLQELSICFVYLRFKVVRMFWT